MSNSDSNTPANGSTSRLSPILREAVQSLLKSSPADTAEIERRKSKLQMEISALREMALVATKHDPANMAKYAGCAGYLEGYVIGAEGWNDDDEDKIDFLETGPFPDTPVEFIEMTPEDEKRIKGE